MSSYCFRMAQSRKWKWNPPKRQEKFNNIWTRIFFKMRQFFKQMLKLVRILHVIVVVVIALFKNNIFSVCSATRGRWNGTYRGGKLWNGSKFFKTNFLILIMLYALKLKLTPIVLNIHFRKIQSRMMNCFQRQDLPWIYQNDFF